MTTHDERNKAANERDKQAAKRDVRAAVRAMQETPGSDGRREGPRKTG